MKKCQNLPVIETKIFSWVYTMDQGIELLANGNVNWSIFSALRCALQLKQTTTNIRVVFSTEFCLPTLVTAHLAVSFVS